MIYNATITSIALADTPAPGGEPAWQPAANGLSIRCNLADARKTKFETAQAVQQWDRTILLPARSALAFADLMGAKISVQPDAGAASPAGQTLVVREVAAVGLPPTAHLTLGCKIL